MANNNFILSKLKETSVEALQTEKVEIPHILNEAGKPTKVTVTELNSEQRMDVMGQLSSKDGKVSGGEGRATILAVCYGLGFERTDYEVVARDVKLVMLISPIVMRLSQMQGSAEKKAD